MALLIYLVDPIHTYVGRQNNWFIPLSSLNISAYIQEKFGSEIEVQVFKFPEKILEAIENRPPNIIGISNYIWNYHLGRAILTYAKLLNPRVVTVMGGPNATLTETKMTGMLADGLIDYYVPDNVAGGEISFASLVEAKLEKNIPLHEHEGVNGVWYLSEDGFARHIKSYPGEKTMDWLPSPFQKGLVDEFFTDGLATMIETNRGCPFHCTFCVWGAQDTNSKVTQFSIERVKADLDYSCDKAKRELLMINDANFGLFKNRDLKIAKHIKKLNNKYNWPVSIIVNWGQVRSDISIAVADELKGITMLRQSSQSIDDKVLNAIRRENIPDYQWRHVANECRQDGIESFAELIIMLPGETFNSYINGLRYFFSLGIDCINTNQCQLLEGAEMNTMEHREKHGIKTAWRLLENSYGCYKNYICIEAEEVVVETNTFSFEENIGCRTLNWLIQMSWTLKRHNLILCLLQEYDISPVDFLLYVIRQIELAPKNLFDLFKEFSNDAHNELFPTYDEVYKYYSCDKGIKYLQEGGFKKLNTYYAGRALVLNKQFIQFYYQMAKKLLYKHHIFSEKIDNMLKECASFTEERSLSAESIIEIEKGKVTEKIFIFTYDFLAWETDLLRRPLSYFKVKQSIKYSFNIESEQKKAIYDYLKLLDRKDKEYQLQKLCEPYYGVRKEYLNYSCHSF